MQALPNSAYFLLLEAAIGGAIGLFIVHQTDAVGRGYTLFTGWLLLLLGALALWLRLGFPPRLVLLEAIFWFDAERTFVIAFLVLLFVFLGLLQVGQAGLSNLIGPVVPFIGLAALWAASLVTPSTQISGLGASVAMVLGATALGGALTSLSLGHWYLARPSMSVEPLVRLTLLTLAAILAQGVLLILLVLLPGADAAKLGTLVSDFGLFLGVRIMFGLLVPIGAAFAAWRTARIRSLDSATGLLYIVAALVMVGEITARTLYFLTGVAT